MAGDILFFLHRNFRAVVVLSGVLTILALTWLVAGPGLAVRLARAAHGGMPFEII